MNDKIQQLIEKLISNTEKNKISWEKTSRDTEFINNFSSGAVSTDKWYDDRSGECIDFRIFNTNGDEIGNWTYATNEDDSKLILDLYSTISRKYLKIDETLDGIFSELE